MSQMNLGRFANPSRTDVLPLGPCQCPDAPHEQDEAVYRLELGAGEEARAGAYGWQASGGSYFDWEAARSKLVEIGVVRWNLLNGEGQPMPVTVQSAALLDEDTRTAILTKLDEVTARNAPLPNASGARSQASTRASASRTRTIRPKG